MFVSQLYTVTSREFETLLKCRIRPVLRFCNASAGKLLVAANTACVLLVWTVVGKDWCTNDRRPV